MACMLKICSGALVPKGMWPVAVQVTLRGDVSSQYLTGMLMAAPLAEGSGAIDILIQGDLVSKPYVDMTIRLMERFGVKVNAPSSCCFKFPVQIWYLAEY